MGCLAAMAGQEAKQSSIRIRLVREGNFRVAGRRCCTPCPAGHAADNTAHHLFRLYRHGDGRVAFEDEPSQNVRGSKMDGIQKAKKNQAGGR